MSIATQPMIIGQPDKALCLTTCTACSEAVESSTLGAGTLRFLLFTDLAILEVYLILW